MFISDLGLVLGFRWFSVGPMGTRPSGLRGGGWVGPKQQLMRFREQLHMRFRVGLVLGCLVLALYGLVPRPLGSSGPKQKFMALVVHRVFKGPWKDH